MAEGSSLLFHILPLQGKPTSSAAVDDLPVRTADVSFRPTANIETARKRSRESFAITGTAHHRLNELLAIDELLSIQTAGMNVCPMVGAETACKRYRKSFAICFSTTHHCLNSLPVASVNHSREANSSQVMTTG